MRGQCLKRPLNDGPRAAGTVAAATVSVTHHPVREPLGTSVSGLRFGDLPDDRGGSAATATVQRHLELGALDDVAGTRITFRGTVAFTFGFMIVMASPLVPAVRAFSMSRSLHGPACLRVMPSGRSSSVRTDRPSAAGGLLGLVPGARQYQRRGGGIDQWQY